LEDNIPSSPAELLAMQQGGIKEEINREDVNALDELIRGEIFTEINPDMNQVLVLTKRLLEDIETCHFDTIDDGDLNPRQKRIWKRDAKKVTEALMALRQVAEG